jgi:hypothetical protein
MGTIQQLINDVRAWVYLVADHDDTPAHLPTPRLRPPVGEPDGLSDASRFDDPPGRAA